MDEGKRQSEKEFGAGPSRRPGPDVVNCRYRHLSGSWSPDGEGAGTEQARNGFCQFESTSG